MSMNVTYKKKGDPSVQLIAIINDTYNIERLAMQDNVTIDISNNIINITILNPSCANEGTFGIVTNINSEYVESQGTFTVQCKYLMYKIIMQHMQINYEMR